MEKNPLKNGKAKAGFILSIVAMIAWVFPLYGLPLSILALIFAMLGIKSAKRGLAVTGIIFSIIAILLSSAIGLADLYRTLTGEPPLLISFLKKSPSKMTLEDAKKEAAKNIIAQNPYSSAKYGFTIYPIHGWQIDDSGRMNTAVIFTNPNADNDNGNSFNANINVVEEKVSGSLSSTVKATKSALAKVLPNYKTTLDEKISVDGVPAELIGATFTNNSMHMENLELLIIKNGRAFTVTATALASTWDKYNLLFKSSILSFSLK